MFRNIFSWFDPYTDWLAHTIATQTVLAPLLLLFLEEAGVPLFIPGDVVLAFTGYRISITQSTSLWAAFFVAMLAVLAGASILFLLARRWGHLIVDKIGKFIFLKPKDIKRAEQLFSKYGAWTIILGRHIPGMRIPLTIFAGTSGMRYRTFILSTFVSTVAWIAITLNLGQRYGRHIQSIVQRNFGLTVGLLAAVIIAILALHFIGKYFSRRSEDS